jgi:hypothetical protein
MQIFSKLQRNSFNYTFIKLFFYFFVALFNSEIIFFPLLIGYIGFNESLLINAFYFSVFSILHQIEFLKTLYFLLFLIFFDYYLKRLIEEYVNVTYQPAVSILIIYIFFMPVIGFSLFNLYYVFYNMAVDIVLYKFLHRN